MVEVKLCTAAVKCQVLFKDLKFIFYALCVRKPLDLSGSFKLRRLSCRRVYMVFYKDKEKMEIFPYTIDSKILHRWPQ
jgi:hypothetical protein